MIQPVKASGKINQC